MASRRHILITAGVMIASAGVATLARPTTYLADEIGKPDLEALFPESFAGWRVDSSMPIVLPAPDVQAALDKIYNQTLARTYVNDRGERIMLSVAYGGDQSDGTSAHRPEVCYPAQGFEITGNQAARLRLGDTAIAVRQLMSRLNTRYEPITYWIVVGDKTVTSGLGQKLAQLQYGLRGKIADGLLVRVSSIDNDSQRGHALQRIFAVDLWDHSDPDRRARIFGDSP